MCSTGTSRTCSKSVGCTATYHRRGSRNFWDFQDDRLLLKDERRKQDIVHLFNHLQHWSIEGQDVLVSDAAVPLHLPLRPRLGKRSRPRPNNELTTLFVRQPVVLGGCSLRERSLPELGRVVRRVLLLPWSCPSSDPLEVWCFFSDRTMATGSRSWRKNWRNRRSLRLLAAPAWSILWHPPKVLPEATTSTHMKVANTKATQKRRQPVWTLCCCGCLDSDLRCCLVTRQFFLRGVRQAC